MVTKLLGVAHSAGNAKTVIEKLGDLKAGETVMLEICPKEAALFEKIHSSNGLVLRDIFDFARKEYGAASATVERRNGVKISEQRKNSGAIGYSCSLSFYYTLFKHIKQKMAKCVFFDSDISREKVIQLNLSKRRNEAEQLTWPIRETAGIRKIIKSNPDYSVIGASHLQAVFYWLRKNNHPATVLFKEQTRPDPARSKARKFYHQKKRYRAMRLRRQQSLIAARKG